MKVKTKDELIELYVEVVNKLIKIPMHYCDSCYYDYNYEYPMYLEDDLKREALAAQKEQLENIIGIEVKGESDEETI